MWLDITSNRGDLVDRVKETLLELVVKNFSEIKNKTAKSKSINNPAFSISAILINSAINEKKELKEEDLEETTEEEPKDKNKLIVNGGYGTINKNYGMSSVVKYTHYDKIWGHLGKFKTNNMYGDSESPNKIAMNNGESSREMVSMETIDKAAKHSKYFQSGDSMGDVGFVPPVGANISSKDWEKYRLMTFMSIYKPLMNLMYSAA